MQIATQNHDGENKYDSIHLEDSYTPSSDEEYMSEKQLAFFRRKLLAWKNLLQEESATTVEHLKEETLDEPDLSDRAAVETDISLELRNRDRLRKLINQIDSALERIDTGNYGYCEETGEEIGIQRLIARPIARMCIEAQEEHEKFERRHNKVIVIEKLSEEEEVV
jgi:DnaK suppressor protein